MRTEAIKLLQVTCAPTTLTLHLKRFTATGRAVKKVNTHVSFPMVLHVLEQLAGGEPSPPSSAAARGAGAAGSTSTGSNLELPDGALDGAGGEEPPRIAPKEWTQLDPRCSNTRRYELVGLVEHSGTYRDGHYTAYVRMPAADGLGAPNWNLFSDSKVTPASEATVLSAQAFLLFYSLVNTSGAATAAPAANRNKHH